LQRIAAMSAPSEQQTPPVVVGIIAANVAIFALEHLFPVFNLWMSYAELRPVSAGFGPWQLLSYGFLHANTVHLVVNMFMVWMFGAALERTLESGPFLIYYLVCVIGAALLHLGVAAWMGNQYTVVGASGGVFGILLAFGLLYPNHMIVLLIPPIPMKAKWFVIVVGAFTLWAGVSQRLDGIAHFAHLGGMVTGLVLLQYWRGRLPIKPRRRLLL
jgi:membrane associated rhomboid family serine protease